MKILFVQPTADKKGHYGKYTINLCQELSRLGNEVTLFCNKAEPDRFLEERPLFRVEEWQGGKFSFQKFDEARKKNPPLYLYGYFRNSFVILRAAIDFTKREKFDVIQVTDVEFGILAALLAAIGRNLPPVILLIHAANFSFSKYPGNFLFRLYKVLQREFLRRRMGKQIKAIVTLGEYHKEELQKQFRLPPSFPVAVIYDGAEPPLFFLDKSAARAKIKIDYPGPIFLLFGILRKDKGIEYLFEAMSMLQDKDCRVLVAGSPFDYTPQDIKNMAKKFGVEDKIIFRLDYVPAEEVPFYFFSSDCVVFPYRKIYTGGTGPLLKEAAMYKKPVIASRVSEMGYLVAKRNMGLLAEPENAESLAEKMKEFLQSSAEQRRQWGENAFSAANTWEKMAKQYVELYRALRNSLYGSAARIVKR